MRLSPIDPDRTIRVSRKRPLKARKVAGEHAEVTLPKDGLLSANLYLRASEIARKQIASIELYGNSTHPLQKEVVAHPAAKKPGIVSLTTAICLSLILLLLGYGAYTNVHDPRYTIQVDQKRLDVEKRLAHAHDIGVPASALQPVVEEKQQIDQSLPWFSPAFYVSPGSAYTTQASQYARLPGKIQNVINTSNQQLQEQAQQSLQQFQIALSRRNMQPLGNSQDFQQRFSTDQLLMGSAHEPRNYTAIIQDANNSAHALNQLEPMSQQLTSMKTLSDSFQQNNPKIQTLQQHYQEDMHTFQTSSDPAELLRLQGRIQTHYHQLMLVATQNFPIVYKARIAEFQKQINLLKSYGKNTGQYVQLLKNDQNSGPQAHTDNAKFKVLQQIDTDIASMHVDLVQGQAKHQVLQFHQEVDSWAKAHPYHDAYDDQDYPLNAGYMKQGIGTFLDDDLRNASSEDDFKMVSTEAENALFNLHMLEKDGSDTTAYNKVHATDTQLLQHYNLQHKQVLMVSLAGQSLRFYQNGQLQQAYQVVTGRQQLPSLPGIWQVLDRKSPAIFTSREPKGSRYWFAPTPIKYAILYHYGGYFVHDVFWRQTFGPGSQFPHQDAGGTTADNFDGSHGCINLTEKDMAWIYAHTDWNTTIVVY
ncbi:hypothetical protein KDA_56670 [Dictyobacter alpinus]|uniref:L,D-TPase catalytic domain-containing protein n=1 Tax=Dictyobacter alpinus TaxID=2014873 RepID=A0A402BFL6_9CHLR|nr:hypothetical protein KDA_56670 [Dictyobacter alpinus]